MLYAHRYNTPIAPIGKTSGSLITTSASGCRTDQYACDSYRSKRLHHTMSRTGNILSLPLHFNHTAIRKGNQHILSLWTFGSELVIRSQSFSQLTVNQIVILSLPTHPSGYLPINKHLKFTTQSAHLAEGKLFPVRSDFSNFNLAGCG